MSLLATTAALLATLVPSCGSQAFRADCPGGSFDPGALVPSAMGTGQAGTACAGRTFTIAVIDAAQGKYRFTPDSTFTCQIDELAPAPCTGWLHRLTDEPGLRRDMVPA